MYFEPPKFVEWPTHTADSRQYLVKAPLHLLAKKPSFPPLPSPARYHDYPPVEVKAMPDTFEAMPMVSMKLPPGRWIYQRLAYGSPSGYNIPLTLKSNSKVELRFSSGGMYVADETSFKSLVDSAPHVLTRDECTAVGIQDFFTEAHTETIDSKRVIVMTGKYTSDNLDVYKILFNHNPDDSEVWVDAEIVYSAPPAEYKKHISEVKKALQTIRWAKRITYVP